MSRVQEKAAQASGVTTASITYTGAVTAGNLLAAGGRINDNTVSVSSFSDTVNGNWPATVLQTNSGDGDWLFWNFFANTAGGTPTVSITISSAANIQWGIVEYSGLATASPLDIKAGNDIASTTTPTTSSITTTNANDLIIGLLCGNNGNLTTATNGQNSFTEWFQSNDVTSGFCFSWTDKTVAATGSYSEAWSTSAAMPCAGLIIALKAASGGTAVTFDYKVPTEWLATARLDAKVPDEFLAGVRYDAEVPDEFLASVRFDGKVPTEWLAGVRYDAEIPGEFTGSTQVVYDGKVPVEWLAKTQFDAVVPTEALGTARFDYQVPFESWSTVRYDAKVPTEFFITVSFDGLVPLEWTGSAGQVDDWLVSQGRRRRKR